MPISIAMADDHRLFLKSLSLLITSLKDFIIIAESLNGQELINQIEAKKLEPDIALIDVNMPVMDGVKTTAYLAANHPAVKCVALSMKDEDDIIIAMLKAGCCAYLLKDIDPAELGKALHEVHVKGYYNGDAANINFRRFLLKQQQDELVLTEKEREFIQLACSDLTYKAIAQKMHMAERTIDGYRETLFKKFNVQSRTGMVLEAIRKKFVDINH